MFVFKCFCKYKKKKQENKQNLKDLTIIITKKVYESDFTNLSKKIIMANYLKE